MKIEALFWREVFIGFLPPFGPDRLSWRVDTMKQAKLTATADYGRQVVVVTQEIKEGKRLTYEVPFSHVTWQLAEPAKK